jgi:hypothetical protein
MFSWKTPQDARHAGGQVSLKLVVSSILRYPSGCAGGRVSGAKRNNRRFDSGGNRRFFQISTGAALTNNKVLLRRVARFFSAVCGNVPRQQLVDVVYGL